MKEAYVVGSTIKYVFFNNNVCSKKAFAIETSIITAIGKFVIFEIN